MSDAIRFNLDDGSSVMFEVADDGQGLHRVGRAADGVIEAGRRLEEALESVRGAASATLHVLRSVAPQTLELEFGIKLTAETGALIARTAGEGHFLVKLSWSSEQASLAAPGADGD